MPLSPTTPLTFWALLVFCASAVITIIPLYLSLRSHQRIIRDLGVRDSLDALLLQLETDPVKNKVQLIVADCISDAVTAHDAAPFAHPQTLARYPNMDQFNGALQRITTEVSAVRAVIEMNERRRGEDKAEIIERIDRSASQQTKAFDDLRANVARAVGRRRQDDDAL